jgi:hypothetical protein
MLSRTTILHYRFLEARLDVNPSRIRLIKLMALLFSALHVCACFFWRVKVHV